MFCIRTNIAAVYSLFVLWKCELGFKKLYRTGSQRFDANYKHLIVTWNIALHEKETYIKAL